MTLQFHRLVSGAVTTTKVLLPNEVHVWGFVLHADGRELSPFTHCLSPDERARADQLLSAQHRQEFIAAHSAVRTVLSRYCAQRPEDLRFYRTVLGKPCLHRATAGSESLRFNLTHSHGRALIAVTAGREVGVDLEAVRPQIDVIKLAKRFLSPKDVMLVQSTEPPKRHERFLQIWVAREAVAKAEGIGLRFPLDRDHVDLSMDATGAKLVGKSHTREFPIRFLPLETGWVGAVAAEGHEWRLTLCR